MLYVHTTGITAEESMEAKNVYKNGNDCWCWYWTDAAAAAADATAAAVVIGICVYISTAILIYISFIFIFYSLPVDKIRNKKNDILQYINVCVHVQECTRNSSAAVRRYNEKEEHTYMYTIRLQPCSLAGSVIAVKVESLNCVCLLLLMMTHICWAFEYNS